MCLSPDDMSDNVPIWPSAASTPTSNVVTFANVVLRKTSHNTSIDSNQAPCNSKLTAVVVVAKEEEKKNNGTNLEKETQFNQEATTAHL